MNQALITELNTKLKTASEAEQMSILRRVTDLFLERAELFSPEQVSVFDDVLSLLAKRASKNTLAELSHRIAATGNAPAKLAIFLARHDNIDIAAPVLESSALPDEALAEVAGSAGEKHLRILVARPQISETVTDVLVGRGSNEVASKLVANTGARLSELGFVKLINRAKTDPSLAKMIGERPDLPAELVPFLKLALAGGA